MQIHTDTLDVQAAAKFLHIHPETVKERIKAGAIPAAKAGRAYVMLRCDLEAYLRQLIDAQTKARMRRVS
jgi:excisionase family DNA binding protein